MGQDQSSSASASKGAEEELKTLPAPQRHLVALDPPLEAKGNMISKLEFEINQRVCLDSDNFTSHRSGRGGPIA